MSMANELNKIEHLEVFKSDVRVLLLAGRNKDKVKDTRQIFRVSRHKDHFNLIMSELETIAQPGERIYSSLTPRSVRKASRIFKQKQLDAEYEQDPMDFYRKLESRWVSSLMSPSSVEREDKLWLVDADNDHEIALAENEIQSWFHSYQTKNGRHYIIPPTNMMEFSEEFRGMVDKNPMMLWRY